MCLIRSRILLDDPGIPPPPPPKWIPQVVNHMNMLKCSCFIFFICQESLLFYIEIFYH